MLSCDTGAIHPRGFWRYDRVRDTKTGSGEASLSKNVHAAKIQLSSSAASSPSIPELHRVVHDEWELFPRPFQKSCAATRSPCLAYFLPTLIKTETFFLHALCRQHSAFPNPISVMYFKEMLRRQCGRIILM